MADVETLCKRIVLIDEGTVKYDGALAELTTTLTAYKLITVTVADELLPVWQIYGDIVEAEQGKAILRVKREQVAPVTARLLAELTVTDLAIENPPLERVIDQIYAEGLA
jgi:ABC-2 type transport system ATP-binding protein